ncbi:hypothetical protein ACB092_05G139400 [Castanea dentata]
MHSQTPNNLFKTRICSPIWAAMKKGAAVFLEGSKWTAGKDSNLSFWTDKWVSKGTLKSLIEGPLKRREDLLLLRDLVGFNGWNWHALSFPIPKHLALEIKATPLPFSSSCEDRISWIFSTNGDFDLKEAYKIACMEKAVSNHTPFQGYWVWNVLSLPKVQVFLWQCCHQSIPTRVALAARGVDIEPLCPLCRSTPETIIHLLRDCPSSKEFWNCPPPPRPVDPDCFYGSNLLDWLELNCRSSLCSPIHNIDWKIVFPLGVWNLWLHWNAVVFNNRRTRGTVRTNTISQAMEFAFLGLNVKHQASRHITLVKWTKPPLN